MENSNGPDVSGPLLSNTPRYIAVVIRVTSSSEISGIIKPDLAVTQSEHKKVAPRDELRGHLVCVRLVGIEPTTSDIVRTALYPMSYNRTQSGN